MATKSIEEQKEKIKQLLQHLQIDNWEEITLHCLSYPNLLNKSLKYQGF